MGNIKPLLELFLVHLKMFYREKEGLYWTIVMPSFIYVALSVLPMGKIINSRMAYSDFVLPGVVAMTAMQGGIYSLAYWVIDLKSRGVTKRLLATPLKQWQLALSLVAARMVVVLVQTALLTLLGVIAFGAKFSGNFVSVALLVALGGAIFLLVGLLISSYAKSYDAAAPITSAVGLPLTFLGSVFYPLETLPESLQTVAKLLPITYLADGLRQAYLYPFNLGEIAPNLLILLLWLILLTGAAAALFRLEE